MMRPNQYRAILILALGAALWTLSAFERPAQASPAAPDEQAAPPDSAYLGQLLVEVNARRARAGTPPVTYAAAEANRAVSRYLADLTPILVSRRACFHGTGNPIAPGWDYVAAAMPIGEARGEVLTCPHGGGYWTAERTADRWWRSPAHARLLYRDPGVNVIACGTYGPRDSAQAFETIACVTFRA